MEQINWNKAEQKKFIGNAVEVNMALYYASVWQRNYWNLKR